MSPKKPHKRAQDIFLQSLYQSLKRLVEKHIQIGEPLAIHLEDGLHVIDLIIRGDEQCAECPSGLTCRHVSPDCGQASVQARVLSVLSSLPQTRAKVARLSGCKLNSHFRQVVADLVRAGQVTDTPDGICLPDIAPDPEAN